MTLQASFIETTIGTAVVNDATASYYNPAALVLLNNPQIIPQITVASLRTRFNGQSTLLPSGLREMGASSTTTHYYSPSLYFGMPANEQFYLGLAFVTDVAHRNVDDSSLLRYVQANNNIQDYDVVPAVALKINEFFSTGIGIDFSYANFNLQPIRQFFGASLADSQSTNTSDGLGIGANLGFLFKPSQRTLIGFNYRSLTTYHLSGKSVYEGSPVVVSNNYHFKLWVPARSTLSINQFLSPRWGVIATLQYTQWSVFTNVQVYNIAGVSGTTPLIFNGSSPYYLRNTWLFTIGSHFRIQPKWIVRAAATYNQSPGNPHYQVVVGDSLIVGVSSGYEINKAVTIDGSYAHAFIQNENINISNSRVVINGSNTGARDAVSLRLLFNV